MSTKIYNAYLWEGTAEELMPFLKELRKDYIEVASTHLVKFHPYIEEKEEEYKAEGKYFRLMSLLQSEIRSGINDPLNIEASAVVYFNQEKIAVQFFGLDLFWDGEKRPLMEKINNHPKLSDYEYWNNVDQDESVSEQQWDEREEFWDFLNVPVEDGLCYELSSFFTLSEICRNYHQKVKKN